MKPARKVSDDGFPARPDGEETHFVAEKLDAEGRRVSGAHGGRTTHGNGKSSARDQP
jgi:hypothetical protein